ncbi:MerR family transcriptional regulator [Kribbella sp. NPDC006257]|uniref:MerR family transcriptional regulator n=1 Tax=Kribbella sp. NPDC006257 TaxID=3156738 RepID=UPI0033A8CD47
MFAIGDFARHGRVSVRMLRHYDAIGLLRPAHVDQATGYRSYAAAQLADLNRLVALKDLGFTLEQVRTMLADELDLVEVRAMLKLRQAELEKAVAESAARLTQVEARLRSIELGDELPAVVVKELPATRYVVLSGVAADFTPEEITPIIRPLCAELGERLPGATGVQPAGRLTCFYEPSGDLVRLQAGVPASVSSGADLNGLTVFDRPAVKVACLVHRGPIEGVLPSWQALARWLDDNGHRTSGPACELYLDVPDDPDQWVTELQEPITS